MELPTPEVQTGLYTLLGFIGTALSGIGVGLYKLLKFFMDQAKAEGEEKGKLTEKINNIEKAIDEDIRMSLTGLGALLGTERSKGEIAARKKNKISD